MSKIAIAGILLLSLVPIAVFLFLPKDQAMPEPALEPRSEIKLAPHASSSVQCNMCLQVPSGESQDQCLRDFACL